MTQDGKEALDPDDAVGKKVMPRGQGFGDTCDDKACNLLKRTRVETI